MHKWSRWDAPWTVQTPWGVVIMNNRSCAKCGKTQTIIQGRWGDSTAAKESCLPFLHSWSDWSNPWTLKSPWGLVIPKNRLCSKCGKGHTVIDHRMSLDDPRINKFDWL